VAGNIVLLVCLSCGVDPPRNSQAFYSVLVCWSPTPGIVGRLGGKAFYETFNAVYVVEGRRMVICPTPRRHTPLIGEATKSDARPSPSVAPLPARSSLRSRGEYFKAIDGRHGGCE
jgi:hypothetical protein